MNVKRVVKLLLQFVGSSAVAAFLLWLLFKDMKWSEFKEAIEGASWGWLLLSQVPLWLSFFTRIWRWGYIVRATAPATFRGMFTSTQIGFLANFTLPLRLGEFVRAYTLTCFEKIPISKSVSPFSTLYIFASSG